MLFVLFDATGERQCSSNTSHASISYVQTLQSYGQEQEAEGSFLNDQSRGIAIIPFHILVISNLFFNVDIIYFSM